MNLFKKDGLRSFVGLLLIGSLLLSTSGCAAMIRGTSQTFRVVTNPPGQTVIYRGQQISDGEYLTVQKQFEPTRFNVSGTYGPVLVELHYDPDPLLICDFILLIPFVVPGLVALGIDFGTGAWRTFQDPQVVYLSGFSPEITLNEEISASPPWAPAHGYRDKYHYRYYSSVSVYFDVERELYFYCNDGQWTTYTTLPAGVHIDLDSYVILEMDTAMPYKFHAEVVKRYPPGHVKNIVKGKIKVNK